MTPGKYREFHQLFADGEFRPAGQLLVSLLTSGVVPKRCSFPPSLSLHDVVHCWLQVLAHSTDGLPPSTQPQR